LNHLETGWTTARKKSMHEVFDEANRIDDEDHKTSKTTGKIKKKNKQKTSTKQAQNKHKTTKIKIKIKIKKKIIR
jgi:hypothetical protein